MKHLYHYHALLYPDGKTNSNYVHIDGIGETDSPITTSEDYKALKVHILQTSGIKKPIGSLIITSLSKVG
jgi:hypothetical protein